MALVAPPVGLTDVVLERVPEIAGRLHDALDAAFDRTQAPGGSPPYRFR